MVTSLTAEPRMEELLASIRKAIHDDIGEVPAAAPGRGPDLQHRAATRDVAARPAEESSSAALEIQQLREKIGRTRSSEPPLRGREIAARPSSLSAAFQHEPPQPMQRSSWRDIDPQSQLRPTIHEADPPLPTRPDYGHRRDPAPEPARSTYQPSWRNEPPMLPPPRDSAPPPHARDSAGILSGDSAHSVQSAFNRLAETVLARATGDRPIEDITRELLRGMLKQWLDENLPRLVEKLVREEIERVARHGR